MSYLDKVIERRDAVKTEMDAVLEAVAAENRTDLTAEETEKVDALVEESRSLDTKIEKLKTQADADVKAAEIRAAVAPVATPVGGARVISEARTYTPQAEASFVKDAYNAQFKNDYAPTPIRNQEVAMQRHSLPIPTATPRMPCAARPSASRTRVPHGLPVHCMAHVFRASP